MNERLLKFQLDSLISGTGQMVVVSNIAAAIFAYVLNQFVPLQTVFIWLGAFTFINIYRTFVWLFYRNRKENSNLNAFMNAHIFGVILLGLGWGSLSFVVLNRLPDSAEGIFVALILGTVINGVVINVSNRKLAMLYAALMLLPFIFKTIYEGEEFYGIYVLLQLSYFWFVYVLVKHFNKGLVRNIELILEKERLLDQLKERLDLERQLKEEKLRSLQASKFAAIGEMTAGVGHEINNPLTIVLGYHWKMAKLLRDGAPSSEVLETLQKSSGACNRIADIVKSMRDFSRMKGEGEMEEVELISIGKMLEPLVEKSLKHAGAELRANIEDCIVLGNKGEFAQVLYNLVSNAIHACQEIKDPVVEIDGKCQEEGAYLCVSNPGDPIPEEVREKMFQPFFTTKDVGKGTGLGLSLAKTIMENNSGELYYEHIKGKNIFTMKMLAMKNHRGEKQTDG